MRYLDEIVKELIPPDDFQHRKDFSNAHLVGKLTRDEKIQVENKLIQMLQSENDHLIGETLALLKSKKALKLLHKKLNSTPEAATKIIWASCIDEINGGDSEMRDLALQQFDRINSKYNRINLFYYLARFEDERINNRIMSFIDDQDFLTAVNARQALEIDTEKIYNREKKVINTWWKFWMK